MKVPQNEYVLVSSLSVGYFHFPDFTLIFNSYKGPLRYLPFGHVLQSWTAELYQSRYCIAFILELITHDVF